MARTFSKNVSNYMKLGTGGIGSLLSGASQIWCHVWINITTTGTASTTDNRIVHLVIGNAVAGFLIAIDNTTANRKVAVGGRSKTADTFQLRIGTSNIPTGQWVSVGGVLNFAAGTITPYYAGVAENSGVATFGQTTFGPTGQTEQDFVACSGGGAGTPASTAVQFDGGIAYVTFGTGDPGANGFAAMAAGADPDLVFPGGIAADFDLLGVNSPERDFWGTKSGTITGSVPQVDGPPVSLSYRSSVPDDGVSIAPIISRIIALGFRRPALAGRR